MDSYKIFEKLINLLIETQKQLSRDLDKDENGKHHAR